MNNMESETVAIIGMMLAPIYGLILWRLKESNKMQIKLTKICTALKMVHPELTDILK